MRRTESFTSRFFFKQKSPEPFMEVRLSAAANVTVADLTWNPGADFASMLCSVMSDGAMGLWEIKESLTILGSLPPTTKATSCKRAE